MRHRPNSRSYQPIAEPRSPTGTQAKRTSMVTPISLPLAEGSVHPLAGVALPSIKRVRDPLGSKLRLRRRGMPSGLSWI